MQYIELVKRVDNQELIIVGLFEKDEIRALRAEGYRKRNYNRNGILVA